MVIGGGAAGIFGAVVAAARGLSVCVVEKRAALLAKVKVSGGGRCNVTHACFDPKKFSENYPRGSQELIGPLHRFGAREMVAWLDQRGVQLKAEEDGRMFPITDSSQTIIDCLLNEAQALGVQIEMQEEVVAIRPLAQPHVENDLRFQIELRTRHLSASSLLLATGSAHEGYRCAQECGHSIHSPVPSLFTFNCPSSPLLVLSGVAVAQVKLSITGCVQQGPLLLTHFGFSGPAALKLSAWAARKLHALEYRAPLSIDWLPMQSMEQTYAALRHFKESSPNKHLSTLALEGLPKRLWEVLIDNHRPIHQCTDHRLREMSEKLHRDLYAVEGKTTHKEEFVTCGGIPLHEVDFRKMESRRCPGLFFAGEILDIDGITGGFNFQSAWTTSWICGNSMG